MNTNTLIKTAKARFAASASKHHLQEKYMAQLTMPYAGGMWKITPEFLTILSMDAESTILVDIYTTPILVNIPEFYKVAKDHYDKIMKAWLIEYEGLTKLR